MRMSAPQPAMRKTPRGGTVEGGSVVRGRGRGGFEVGMGVVYGRL